MAQLNSPQSHRVTEKARQGDKGSGRQEERKTKRKFSLSPCLLVSLSPCLLVSLSLWQRLLPAALRLRPLFGRLRKLLPPVFFNALRELVLAAGQVFEFAPHLQVVLEARGVERA